MNAGTQDVGLSISAAGTTQATATLLINGINVVTTAGASSGVRLQLGNTGTSQIVFNGGANPVSVYPPSDYKINNLATNGAMVLGTNTTCEFWTVSGTQIIANLSA